MGLAGGGGGCVTKECGDLQVEKGDQGRLSGGGEEGERNTRTHTCTHLLTQTHTHNWCSPMSVTLVASFTVLVWRTIQKQRITLLQRVKMQTCESLVLEQRQGCFSACCLN